MKFNLIDEKWIPVKRKDGTPDIIRPWEITDNFADNPVVALNAPRADFNGALIQFLIGLVQTTFAPDNRIEWKNKLKTPPSPEQLKTAFMTVHHAFELGGNEPRFMQDFERNGGKEWNCAFLLLDSPGDNTLENNQDHFVKRGRVNTMCLACAATALFTLQVNAPYGGVGHQSSIRGGGPLTTLVLSHKNDIGRLWETIWLNTLESKSFLNACCNPEKQEHKYIFIWLTPTRTSEKGKGLKTVPQDVHPAHLFWSFSRRIVLNIEKLESAKCDLCGMSTSLGIRNYKALTFGTSYEGNWLHPLSPHKRSNNQTFPVQAHPGGITYRHWLGLVQEDQETLSEPATVVHRFRENPPEPDSAYRLWAFGYDTDPKRPTKARCWYEGRMPLIQVDSSVKDSYEQAVASLITVASKIASNTRSAVKKAWTRRPEDVKGDMYFLDSAFWNHTEEAFYKALSDLKNHFESGRDGIEAHKTWHITLINESLTLFDIHAWNGPIEDADPKRVVIARNDLIKFNHSKKIKELLGLPA
jgi:CRISPR system Cascade subunit CasA